MSDSAMSDYFSTDSAFDMRPEDELIITPQELPPVIKTLPAAPEKLLAPPTNQKEMPTAAASPTPASPAPSDVIPDDDYFNRFRKLYEPVPEPTAPARAEPSVPRTPSPAAAPNPVQSRTAMAAPVNTAPSVPPATQVPTKTNPIVSEKNPAAATMPNAGPPSETPSLQDLLKELESERLSDEDEAPLNEKQISDLIQRITNDY
jgi:hypothetical protein